MPNKKIIFIYLSIIQGEVGFRLELQENSERIPEEFRKNSRRIPEEFQKNSRRILGSADKMSSEFFNNSS